MLIMEKLVLVEYLGQVTNSFMKWMTNLIGKGRLLEINKVWF